ncbi:ribonuclease R [Persicobacter psychrovividus]|uniref:Ribonuclease R n=1 Tax=Persicobacter psychrovividus TaxID=387638 RepID=A0ABN6LD55_9BACT|nr:ribonuclease R [Persicobacter psychrovividus]
MGRKNKKTSFIKKRRTREKQTTQNLHEKIVQLLNNDPGKAWSVKQLCRKLLLKDRVSKQKAALFLEDLARDGDVSINAEGRYQCKEDPNKLVGIVDHVNPRMAFVIIEGREDDIKVTGNNLNYALDGDKVEVSIINKHGDRAEGRVTKIVERGKDEWVGKIEILPRFAFVVPDNKKIYKDVFVPLEHIMDAKHGQKVIVKVRKWADAETRNAMGKVTRVLGNSGDNEAEIHSIMAEYGLPFDFPKHVLKESEGISEAITEEEIAKRRDFRNITTFTIDPVDAKDFDDALSFQKLPNGNIEIGVHIADVSHYVRPNTKVEEEAYHRATSVYLVDRTIPMLPERLSNKLCSLRPNEEKLTFSAVFELNENAEIQQQWFGRTVIHSDRRFTYEEAQERIESQEGDFSEEIIELNRLAKIIKDRRFKSGAIAFETIEVKFQLDEHGKPLMVVPRERKDAHKLIEEFMLLANKKVAEFVFKKKAKGDAHPPTFIYRTHDYPNNEKLESFGSFAKRFGHQLRLGETGISHEINKLMAEIQGKPEQNVLEQLAIRSMAKAIYTTDPLIHFGLAFEHYTHFTSPIRRYPDMMVHRLLQHYLDGGKSADRVEYEKACEHSSEREKRAAEAERASIKYKQVEFMQNAPDKQYEGVITGVTEFGIFVEITETRCEGMVRMVDMKDDFYEYDEKNLRMIGRNNKRMFSLGDRVQVRVKHTDINRRTIDLIFSQD